jgi:peptidoglycan/LPS O-acetylase OafA/YrhL
MLELTTDSATGTYIITPLTSLRFFAALHIFLFHAAVIPDAPPNSPSPADESRASESATTQAEPSPADPFPTDSAPLAPGGESAAGLPGGGVTAGWPVPLRLLLFRGYCSTSLFFILSGFVLAYLYVDAAGCQTVSNRDFWLSRWVRIYPLHIAVLPLLVPFAIMMMNFMPTATLFQIPVSKPAFALLSGAMSLLLVQAWCPEAALSWNFATWALSAVVFFYVMFPPIVRWLRGQTRRAFWIWLALMPVLNLIPSIIFLSLPEPPPMGSFWAEFVMRTPLLWLPHFIMGVILSRVFGISRHDMRWIAPPRRTWPSWGDLAAAILLILMITPDSFFQTIWFLGTKPPNFLLRHGTLAPLHCVVIYNLALSRGWLARLLSRRLLEKLGEASFGIFILQGPVGFPLMFALSSAALPPAVRLAVTTVVVVGLALISVRFFERPLSRRLRKRFVI